MLKPPRLLGACVALCLSLLPASAGADDFTFGVGTHSAPDQGLALIHDAGVTSLRDDIHWQEVEREKGALIMPERYERYVNGALRRGIDPVLILCYGNPLYDGGGYPVSDEAKEAYTRFAEFVVSHFADASTAMKSGTNGISPSACRRARRAAGRSLTSCCCTKFIRVLKSLIQI